MRTSAQKTSTSERRGAYAFVQLTDGHVKEVIDLLETLAVVESVEAIRGPYQLIARLAGDDATPLRQIDGVARVVTATPAGGAETPRLRAPGGRRRRGLVVRQPCGMPA